MDEKSFVHEVAVRVRCDERRAESLIFAVFTELRDHLTRREASDVAAQLPVPLKRLWLSFDRPERQVRRVHLAEFVGEVRRMAGLPDDIEAERAIRAVFKVLQKSLGSPTGISGEAWDVMSQLPRDLKQLWIAAAEEESS